MKLPVLCPSAKCEPGAVLLGVVQENGRVALLADEFVIDQAFVDAAHQGRTPEKRFRFAAPCVQEACKHWTGVRCGVIDAVLHDLGQQGGSAALPECSIRPQCRWFRQTGPSACRACPEVITDLSETGDAG